MKTTIEVQQNDSNFATCKVCHKELEHTDGIKLAIIEHRTHGTSTDSMLLCNDCAMKIAEVLQNAVIRNASK